MTVDFRPPEETGVSARAPAHPAQQGRRLVQVVLAATAVLMVVAGVAIWLTSPPFLAPQTAPWVAMALVLAGVFDALMAWGVGRWWLGRVRG